MTNQPQFIGCNAHFRLKSFIIELRLDKILSQMKEGDYLFIQFGHNDMKKQWPQTSVEPFTTHRQYLKVLIAEARLRGAIPVLVTRRSAASSTDRRSAMRSMSFPSRFARQQRKKTFH